MQAGARPMMQSHTPHMQHPPQPHFDSNIQHVTLPGGRVMSFDSMNMDEQTRAILEQQQRMAAAQGHGGGLAGGVLANGRDGKAAQQRQLGVGGAPMQHPPQHVMQPAAAARPIGVSQNGQQYFLDQQGRAVPISAWQQGPPRVAPGGQFAGMQPPVQLTQQQHHQLLQQQFAAQQAYQQQQQRQQQQQHAAQQQQHQQQAQQHAQQQQMNQAQQQRMASQPPSARPPPITQTPGQSPALLQVPPPPLKRVATRTASRSASPIPPHLRPPPASVAQPMQMSTSAMATATTNPPLLPVRASTLPASIDTSAEAGPSQPANQPTEEPSADPSRFASPTAKPQMVETRAYARSYPMNDKRVVKMSAVAIAKKKEDVTTRLKRTIEMAQARLEQVAKDAEEVKMAAGVEMSAEVEIEKRKKFDELVLEYLQRAGYSTLDALRSNITHEEPLKSAVATATATVLGDTDVDAQVDDSNMGDAILVENTSGDVSLEVKTPLAAESTSPVKLISPMKQPTTPTWNDDRMESMAQSPIRSGSQVGFSTNSSHKDPPNKGENIDEDSIFGNEKDEDEDNPMDEDMEEGTSGKDEGNEREEMVLRVQNVVDAQTSPLKAGEPEQDENEAAETAPTSTDLGYLYNWWAVFEDTQRLIRQNLLKLLLQTPAQPHTTASAPNTAIPPTSAMAARIAVSAPAAAVRASSADANPRPMVLDQQSGPSTVAQGRSSADAPPTAITARLKAAEEMRRVQQAHIEAAQEEMRRRAMMQSGQGSQQNATAPPTHRPAVIMTNGNQIHMTPEQVHQHMLAQAQYVQSRQHAYAPHMIHPQAQHPQQFPQQLNGAYRSDTPNGSMRQVHPMEQQFMQHMGGPESVGSPSDGGIGYKRQADPSPVDGSAKKAKKGKRPTPEEHQRQAIEVANRAAQHMPAPPGIPPISNHMHPLQRQTSQSASRPLTDAERQYAQGQAAYARQHVVNSPASMMHMSPPQMTGSPMTLSANSPPSSFNLGMNIPSSAKSTKSKGRGGGGAQSLNLDGGDDMSEHNVEVTPTSATSTKRKASAKKTGPKGGSRAKKITKTERDREREMTPSGSGAGYTVPITPTLGGADQSTGQEMQYDAISNHHMSQTPGQLYGVPSGNRSTDHANGNANGPDQHQHQMQHQHHQQQRHQHQYQHQGQGGQGGQEQDQKHEANPNDGLHHVDDDFLTALGSFTASNDGGGVGGGGGGQVPVSATQLNFDEAFDFDWSTANFGDDEHDWSAGLHESTE